MAPRNPQGNGSDDTAHDVVFGNFGDDLLDNEQDIQDLDNENDQPTDDDFVQDDDPFDTDRVSHTEDDRERRQPQDRRQQQRQPQQRQPQQRQPQQQQKGHLPRQAEVRPDGKGNLVDRATGQVVAAAGREARYYQSMQEGRQRAETAERTVRDVSSRLSRAVELGEQMAGELETFRSREAQITEFGLQPEQHLEAIQLYAEGLRDPVGVIQKLLTRAAANGIDVSKIGGGVNGAFDPKQFLDIVRGEIQKTTKPITEAEKARQEQQRTEQARRDSLRKTQETVTRFFDENQEARPYVQVFERILADPRFSGMSLGEVWARIQLQQVKRGNQRPSGDDTLRRPPSRRMPRGQGAPFGNEVPEDRRDNLAPVSKSYDDILRGVMKDHGM